MELGTAAEWATVVIALGAAWIALRTYRSSAWDKKVAAARLVWAEKGVSLGYSKGKKMGALPESLFPGPGQGDRTPALIL
jgi:hypothetical protein